MFSYVLLPPQLLVLAYFPLLALAPAAQLQPILSLASSTCPLYNLDGGISLAPEGNVFCLGSETCLCELAAMPAPNLDEPSLQHLSNSGDTGH